MHYEVSTTEDFDIWLDGLRDVIAQEAIAARLVRITGGNFGDHASVGDGVSELRIHHGPGYRAYYVVRGRAVVFMLCGGDKKTQSRDIKTAKEMASDL